MEDNGSFGAFTSGERPFETQQITQNDFVGEKVGGRGGDSRRGGRSVDVSRTS